MRFDEKLFGLMVSCTAKHFRRDNPSHELIASFVEKPVFTERLYKSYRPRPFTNIMGLELLWRALVCLKHPFTPGGCETRHVAATVLPPRSLFCALNLDRARNWRNIQTFTADT